jgi:2'-5' RNA ligase
MRRTFIAIDIPASAKIKKCLHILSSGLAGEKIRWMADNNLHLTIKFLGDTEEKTIPGIVTKLTEITKNLTAFPVTIKKVGVFKNLRDPRIIWLGIEADKGLAELKTSVENQISMLGFPPEDRKFSPHLTVGRIKFLRDKNKLHQIIDDYQEQILHQFFVKELVFYESILKKEGPEYIPLGRYRLKNPVSHSFPPDNSQ